MAHFNTGKCSVHDQTDIFKTWRFSLSTPKALYHSTGVTVNLVKTDKSIGIHRK